jgi:hypothetical protein
MLLLNNSFDIALIDLMLPPSFSDEGLALLRYTIEKHPNVIPLLMTVKERGTTEIVAEAMTMGARYFFDKNSFQFSEQLLYKLREVVMEKNNNVFISHGHNELLKLKLKDFILVRLKKTPIILAEQPSRGLTIVEKLERVSEHCRFAIILMTKDDEQKEGGVRARQNVIHEIGFFQGKYGRKNVILLAEMGVEMFTNISGIVQIEFEPANFERIFEPLRIEIEDALKD